VSEQEFRDDFVARGVHLVYCENINEPDLENLTEKFLLEAKRRGGDLTQAVHYGVVGRYPTILKLAFKLGANPNSQVYDWVSKKTFSLAEGAILLYEVDEELDENLVECLRLIKQYGGSLRVEKSTLQKMLEGEHSTEIVEEITRMVREDVAKDA
jgi:hypothetical protein